MTVFVKTGRKGRAHLMIERYLKEFPNDNEAQLDRLALNLKYGVKADGLIEKFRPENVEEHMRLAVLLSNGGNAKQATACYRAILLDDPSNMAARQGLIENLSRQQQLQAVRKALDEIWQITPKQTRDWAFIALHASRSGYHEMFRAAATKAEAELSAEDDHSLFMLARAHANIRNRDDVVRLFAFFKISSSNSSWILIKLFEICGEFGLWRPRFDIAERLLQLGPSDVDLQIKLERILKQGKPADGSEAKAISLWC
jgi:tetratricopeptide (TPR) repeat protein